MKMEKLCSIPILVFIFNLSLCYTILVETNKNKEKYCYSKQIDKSDTINLSYIISGENEEKVNAVLSYDDHIIYHHENSVEGEFKGEAEHTGFYQLCFLPLNSNNYYISFEFFTNFEKGHTLNMAKDENFHDMKKEVGNIALMFEEMEKNIKFIMDRRNKHTEVISDIGIQIRQISYLKIAVVLLVSFLQVFLIQRFFGGKKAVHTSHMGHSSLFEMSGQGL